MLYKSRQYISSITCSSHDMCTVLIHCTAGQHVLDVFHIRSDPEESLEREGGGEKEWDFTDPNSLKSVVRVYAVL